GDSKDCIPRLEKRVQWADGFILVYSICDRASFNVLRPKVQVIKAAKEALSQEKVPIVIVGNKRDLHHRRAVSSEEGRLLALSMDCEFYEVSAAEAYHGALMVFQGLAERICEAKLALKKVKWIPPISHLRASGKWLNLPLLTYIPVQPGAFIIQHVGVHTVQPQGVGPYYTVTSMVSNLAINAPPLPLRRGFLSQVV
uniref:small monomeric GTPase n=1 Tax=Terrapene triunguis TaxID=2587831 RepID=A0A674KAM9_9SAUR